jgi:hypothetical protein
MESGDGYSCQLFTYSEFDLRPAQSFSVSIDGHALHHGPLNSSDDKEVRQAEAEVLQYWLEGTTCSCDRMSKNSLLQPFPRSKFLTLLHFCYLLYLWYIYLSMQDFPGLGFFLS